MRKSLLCIGLAYIFLQSNAIAQIDMDSVDIYDITIEDLMGIRIASNVVTEEQKQPVSVTIIKREQSLLSGCRTLADAIRMYVPGFFVVEDQDDVISAFRGLVRDNNSKVMLLLNGQNMNTEFFWGPPDAILNSTNYDYIERVEIIRGPGSVILGQGALLGVVNIVTKNNLHQGNEPVSAAFSTSLGSGKYYSNTLEANFQKNDFNSYFFFSKRDFQGQRLRNEGFPERANEGFAG